MHAPSYNGGDLVSTTDQWYAAGATDARASTTVALSATLVYVVPQYIERPIKIDKIGIDVTTTNAGSCRIGIFEPIFRDFSYAGRCIAATGSFDSSVSGVQTAPLTVNLLGGRYYYFALYNISGTPSLRASAATEVPPFVGKDTPVGSNSIGIRWLPTSAIASFFNAMPTFGTKDGSNCPIIYYHVAS
jgi:hypothetical protein